MRALFEKIAHSLEPRALYRFADKAIPCFWCLTLFFGLAGLITAFWIVLPDIRQGAAFRIIFVHVPASWMSLFIYLMMALLAIPALVCKARAFHLARASLAPTGALFTFLSLFSGALWGKPTWGTWWVWWDARLVSELILLFMYAGLIVLQSATDNPRRADRATALLTLVGAINLPIIYFSVRWWHTLHQDYSITLSRPPTMGAATFWGILLCVAAFLMYSAAVSLMRLKNQILEHENNAIWFNGQAHD